MSLSKFKTWLSLAWLVKSSLNFTRQVARQDKKNMPDCVPKTNVDDEMLGKWGSFIKTSPQRYI